MIDKETLQTLNEKELQVYRYVETHKEQVGFMRIRELAERSNVSTATILRFVKKLGLHNYNEFKYWCKQKENLIPNNQNQLSEIMDCLAKIDTFYYQELLLEAVELIQGSPLVIFTGIGNSGGIAHYGARCFSNAGTYAICQDDPFYNGRCVKKQPLIIVLSVSGETAELIQQISGYRQAGCPILLITTSQQSSLAKMSDLTIAYHVKYCASEPTMDFTSQIPAVHILEKIALELSQYT